MNYSKKIVIFITMNIFFLRNTYKIRRLQKVYTLRAFIFFLFGHRVET